MSNSPSRHSGKHPASAFDVANVHFSTIYDPTLHLVMQADGAFDVCALEAAVAAAGTMAPILASHYGEEDDRGYWQSGMGDKPAFSVHKIEGPIDPNFLPLVSIDPFTGPQMDVRLCRSTGEEGDVLIISAHHGAMDANGLFQAAALCADAYRRICSGKPPVFQGPSWEYRGTDAILSGFSAEELDPICERESACTEDWSFPYRDRPCGKVVWELFAIGADTVTSLRAAGKESGVTLNDRILAAYFCALIQVCDKRYAESNSLGVLGAMDLRRYLPDALSRSICNLSVAYTLSLSPACCGEMGSALTAVSEAMRELKNGRFGLGSTVFYERLYAGGTGAVKAFMDGLAEEYRLTGKKNPFVSNVGEIPAVSAAFRHGMDDMPLEITTAYLTTREAYPPGIGVYVSTYRGKMIVTIPFCTDAHTPEDIRALADAMQRFLLEEPLKQ
ncbi:hypothetical protein [Methanogenium organophilum]|uniref:Condensation domain-containing protein n=1 Tax=Methanogenium organophilum TaxID=2199 RepID=A0A9X9S5J6_METOG|nr:hypothetical protein [Methanogenium organophilum]WAI02071.1 hypothetical protein OU421_04155 [Methanogenium organophilum]